MRRTSIAANLRAVFSAFYEALHLDIWDMSYSFSNPTSFARYKTLGDALPIKVGIHFRIGSFFFHMLEGAWLLLSVRKQKIQPDAALFFAITNNQAVSLRPIWKRLSNSYLVKDRHNVHEDIIFPAFWAYVLSLLFLPVLLIRFWQARNQRDIHDAAKYWLDSYWLTYGYYIVARFWIRQVKPRVLIVSNDHAMQCRVLTLAAKRESIPTVYVQHAAASDEFPPLSFDYALLDGLDALEIYDGNGPSETVVYLVGSPKFDPYLQMINDNQSVESIGICTNILDDFEEVEKLCTELCTNFETIQFHLRPHPADERKERWVNLAKTHDLRLSDPNQEGVYEFLQDVDLIFAGNSSIHVEAALLNVYPAYFDFANNPDFQVYSFLDRELCDNVSSIADARLLVEQLVKVKPPIRTRALPYCATIGSDYDGRSLELTSMAVEAISEQSETFAQLWRKVDGIELSAFQTVESDRAAR